jgi:hypothetical protein
VLWIVYGLGSPLVFEAYSAELAEHMAVQLTGADLRVSVFEADIDGDLVLS